MAKFVGALREEIARVARKEMRGNIQGLHRASAQYRRHIAALRRSVAALERQVAIMQPQVLKDVASTVDESAVSGVRFNAKGLRSLRRRLGLSAADFGTLVRVSGQTVYNWERGSARPRKRQLAAVAAARALGKREALARLEQLRSSAPAKRPAAAKAGKARKARRAARRAKKS